MDHARRPHARSLRPSTCPRLRVPVPVYRAGSLDHRVTKKGAILMVADTLRGVLSINNHVEIMLVAWIDSEEVELDITVFDADDVIQTTAYCGPEDLEDILTSY